MFTFEERSEDRKFERHGVRHTRRAYSRVGRRRKGEARQKCAIHLGKASWAGSSARRPRLRSRVNPPVIAAARASGRPG